jgi:hypothetical protein
MSNLWGESAEPPYHPLEHYLGRSNALGSRILPVTLGATGWCFELRGRKFKRHKYRSWEQQFVNEFEIAQALGRVSWSLILALSRGTLTPAQVRGKRTNVQLTLPLILRQPIGRRGTRAIQTTGS